jgi:hypothetical protein
MPEGSGDGASSSKSTTSRAKKITTTARTKPSHTLPTVRVSFGNQLNLLRGFSAASGASSKPVTLEEVSAVTKNAVYTTSVVTPFLADVGLIQRMEQKGEAWKYLPSAAVVNFARAFEWNRETASHKLAEVLSRSWFAEALMPRLAYDALTEEESITVLAEAATAGPEYRGSLALLLDYLEAAGMIQRDNGNVRRAKRSTQAELATAEPSPPEKPEEKREATGPRASAVSTAFVQPTLGVVNFHVDVKIDMAEFAGWSAERITAFFSGIAQVLSAKAAIENEQGAVK